MVHTATHASRSAAACTPSDVKFSFRFRITTIGSIDQRVVSKKFGKKEGKRTILLSRSASAFVLVYVHVWESLWVWRKKYFSPSSGESSPVPFPERSKLTREFMSNPPPPGTPPSPRWSQCDDASWVAPTGDGGSVCEMKCHIPSHVSVTSWPKCHEWKCT